MRMKRKGWAGALAAVVALLFTPACATTDGDGAGTQGAAQTDDDPLYDAVVSGGPSVQTDGAHTASQSASTRVVSYFDGFPPADVNDTALDVRRWSEIRDDKGDAVFTKATVVTDDSSGGIRTLVAKVELDGHVTIDIAGTARQDGDGYRVVFTNTSGYTHWLLGEILQPRKLVLDVKILPYAGGTIFDATMRVKLVKRENDAPKLTGAIASFAAWLGRQPRSAQQTPEPQHP